MAQNVDILIRSFFQDSGIRKATNQFKQLRILGKGFSSQIQSFNNLKGFSRQAEEVKLINSYLSQFNVKLNSSGKLVDALSSKFLSASQSAAAMQKITQDMSAGGFQQFEQGFGKSKQEKGGMAFSGLMDESGRMQEMKVQDAFLNKFGLSLDNLSGAAQKNTAAFQKMKSSMMTGGFETFRSQLFSSKKALEDLGISASNVRREFQMEFLGVMFFGMMIQQAFQSLAKSTVNSFMKITEGMHPAAQAVNALKANFELLKFSIGEAIAGVLEALTPTIINIVTKLADWVQQNKKLAGWIVIISIVGGFLLFMIGQLSLGLVALKQVIDGIIASRFITWIASLVGGAGFGLLIKIILIVVVIIGILKAAWMTNFAGIREFTTGTLGIIFELFKTIFKGVTDLVVIAFSIIKNIFKGDWKAVWNLTKLFGVKLFKLFLKVMTGIGMIGANVLSFLLNIFKDTFFGMIKIGMKLGAKIVDVMISIGERIATAILTPIEKALEGLGDFISRIGSTIASIPGFSSIGNKIRSFGNALSSIKPTDAVSDVADDLRKLNDNTLKRSLGVLNELDRKLTAKYFDKSDFNDFSKMIEENDKFTQQIREQGDAKNFFGVSVDDNESVSKVTSMFDSVNQKVNEATTASDSMAQQNLVEAESWQLKTSAAQEYEQTLQRITDLQQNTGDSPTGDEDLDRSLANFAVSNINLG